MSHLCIRRILVGTAVAFAPGPAAGQTVVYDPSNDAQNVLQAARALQRLVAACPTLSGDHAFAGEPNRLN